MPSRTLLLQNHRLENSWWHLPICPELYPAHKLGAVLSLFLLCTRLTQLKAHIMANLTAQITEVLLDDLQLSSYSSFIGRCDLGRRTCLCDKPLHVCDTGGLKKTHTCSCCSCSRCHQHCSGEQVQQGSFLKCQAPKQGLMGMGTITS